MHPHLLPQGQTAGVEAGIGEDFIANQGRLRRHMPQQRKFGHREAHPYLQHRRNTAFEQFAAHCIENTLPFFFFNQGNQRLSLRVKVRYFDHRIQHGRFSLRVGQRLADPQARVSLRQAPLHRVAQAGRAQSDGPLIRQRLIEV